MLGNPGETRPKEKTMPRPRKDEAVRVKPVSVTMNPQQKAALDKAAEGLSLSRSGMVCRIAELLECGALTVEQIALASVQMAKSRA
jgi:hypothetical protein